VVNLYFWGKWGPAKEAGGAVIFYNRNKQ